MKILKTLKYVLVFIFLFVHSDKLIGQNVKKSYGQNLILNPQKHSNQPDGNINSVKLNSASNGNALTNLRKPDKDKSELIQDFEAWRKKCGTAELEAKMRAAYPQLGSIQDFENWMGNKVNQYQEGIANNRTSEELLTIPVVFHIVHNGESVGTGDNISANQVVSQLKVLNQDFRRLNDDASQTPSYFAGVAADIEIQFKLATVDPNGIPLVELGIDRSQAPGSGPWTIEDINSMIKPTTIWDPEKYMNIWVLDLGDDVLGFSSFPISSGLDGLNGTPPLVETEGVVIRSSVCGSNFTGDGSFSLLPGNNRGRTLTHEVGHFFGLRHIWGDGDCSQDDFVTDTPLSAEENFVALPNCGQGVNSCDEGVGDLPDMVQNYMDFSFDGCMNLFTAGQKLRIRTVLLNSPRRMELPNSDAADPTDPDGVFAGFDVSVETICQGETVTFTDFSDAGSNTTLDSWDWNFDVSGIGGASMSTTTGEGPHMVQFDLPGMYEVTLEVGGDNASTDNVSKFINVLSTDPTGTIPEIQGFEIDFPPENWDIVNDGFITWAPVSLGSRGSENSTFINNFSNNLSGLTNIILATPSFDLSGTPDAFLYFDVAYAAYLDADNGDAEIFDDLAIVYSTNCGIDFNELVVLSGESLATEDPINGVFIPEDESSWQNIQIDISDFPAVINAENVIFGFSNRGNFGNLIFIDNVVLSTAVDQLPSIGDPIEDVLVFIDSPDSVISLVGVFTDEDNDDNSITIEVIANSNPGLVSTDITGSDLTLSFTPDEFGSSAITLEGTSNGLTITTQFLVRVLSNFEVIYSQNNIIGSSFFSSEFTDLDAALQAADDFIVPAGAIYSIREVFAPGFFGQSSSQNPTGLILEFYEDDNGQPGTMIFSEQSDLAGTISLTDTAMVFPLSNALELTEGTYWVSILPETDLSTNTFWNWFESISDNNQGHYMRDEADVLGGGFTDWTSLEFLLNRKADLAFELRGEINGEVPPKRPTNLTASSISDTQIDLTWEDNSDNETGFKIWRSDVENGPFTEVGQVPIDVTSFSDITVNSDNACEIWFYQVTADKAPSASVPSNTIGVATSKLDIPLFTEFTEDFEGDFPPMGWEILNIANGGVRWEKLDMGFDGSSGSLIIDNYNNDLTFEAPIILTIPSFDFSTTESLFLTFDIAYTGYRNVDQQNNVTNLYDSLVVAYSLDCGLQYTILEILGGESLETAPTTSDEFIPADNSEWKNVTLNLGDLLEIDTTLSNIRLALANFAGFAQTIYIDNFTLSQSIDINAPSELSGTSSQGSQISLIWQDNANNEGGMVVERSENDQSNFEEIASLDANVQTYTDTDVAEDITYFYRVKAINGPVSSEYSNVEEVYNEPLGISKALLEAVSIYPNPNNGSVNVTIEGYENENLEITILDPLGKVMNKNLYQVNREKFGYNVDFTKSINGIYLIQVKTNEGTASKRLIKIQ